MIIAPAQEAIEYEAKPVDGLAEGSIYAGYPNPESDAAWAKLVEGTFKPRQVFFINSDQASQAST